MRFLRFTGSVFSALLIVAIMLFAASVFNEDLSEKMKDVGKTAITAIKEFSEKAEVNAFSEDLR